MYRERQIPYTEREIDTDRRRNREIVRVSVKQREYEKWRERGRS